MIINFSVQNFGSIKEKQTLSSEATNSKHLEEHFVVQIGFACSKWHCSMAQMLLAKRPFCRRWIF